MSEEYTPSVSDEVAAGPTLEEQAREMGISMDDHSTVAGDPAPTQEDLILGKFKSTEDLASAYESLQQKMGQQGGDLSQPMTQAAQYYEQNGNLDESHYQALDRAGLNRQFVDAYIAGQQAQTNIASNELILVDGWDRSDINKDIASCGIYFKRELFDFYSDIALPISFSIPEEKICDPLEKSFDFAPLVPNCVGIHQDSYIYDNEKDYYNDYRKSHFAYTCKKGRDEMINEGWDCMRHYEILACGCVPFFTDIEKCQTSTLARFPKDLCIEAKKISGVYPGTKEGYNPDKETFIGTAKEILPGEKRGNIDFSKFDSVRYNDIREQLIHHTRKKLTTVSTAKDFLDRIKTWG